MVNVLDQLLEIGDRQVGLDQILNVLFPLRPVALNGLANLVVNYFPDGQYESGVRSAAGVPQVGK